MLSQLKQENVRNPNGFATTTEAYRNFLQHNNLEDRIRSLLDERHRSGIEIHEVGKRIQRLFTHQTEFPEAIADSIREAYNTLSERYETDEVDVAVRSSVTAEDLPEASFAEQQETFLSITGFESLLEVCRKCFASLFTDRAISYREGEGFDHMQIVRAIEMGAVAQDLVDSIHHHTTLSETLAEAAEYFINQSIHA